MNLLSSLLFVGAAAAGGTSAPPVVVFRHVNVVPMDEEHVLADQLVVVKDGSIVAITAEAADGKTAVPEDATVVDGKGAFLLPGLADLHTHSQHVDDLFLYVANGVTTMLNLGLSWPNFVTQTRARIRAGEVIAPTCFVAPMMNGPRGSDLPCASVDEARASVRLAKEMGYEFIKVYNDLSRPLFRAICEEAHEQGLAVVGHGVREPGLEESFETGQIMVAHGEEYLYTILAGTPGPGARGGINVAKMPEAVELTKKHGVYVIPNLSAYEAIANQWGKQDVADGYVKRDSSRVMRPWWRRQWSRSRYATNTGSLDKNLAFLREFTKALHDGGVRLLLGTDSPDIPGMQAGYSIHDDLRNLVQSGLTPFQAIECGTRIAGEFIAECVPDAEAFGTIAIGQRADLILVEKNPLEDVARLKEPLGVMVRGRWLPRAELARRLDEMAARFTQMEACERTFLDEGEKSGFAVACANVRAAGKAASHAAGQAAIHAAGQAAIIDEETLNETAYGLLRNKNKRDEALEILKLNTELHPESANTFDSYGEVLAMAGRTDESRESYRQALKLDPKSPTAKRALAEAPASR